MHPASRSALRGAATVSVALVAVVALLLSGAMLIRPVLADHGGFDHQPLPIDTSEFGEDSEECEDVELAEGEVLLHFIANQQSSTDPLTLTLTLEGGATVSEESDKIVANGKTHHFNFLVSGDVVITDLDISSGEGNVRLSHVCRGPEEQEELGSIEVLKTDEQGAPLAGAEFTVEGVEGTFTSGEDGTFCVDGLALGAELDVTETAAPPGYVAADPATQAVTVSVAGDCDERGDAAVDATFVNVAVEAETGILEIDKFFCPGDETRTEIDILGPVAPQPLTLQQEDELDEGCTVGADVTFEIWAGETLVDTVMTDETGIVEVELAAGTYLLVEPLSGASAEFTIAEGQLTAALVINFIAAEVGQVKVVKYFCETGGTGVTFTIEGQNPPPSLEGCEPGDAEFELNGAAFATSGGIALLEVEPGTYVLAETSPNVAASGEFEVLAGQITTVIVVNYPPEGEEEELGSIEVLKTDEQGAPLAGAEFTVEGVEGTFTSGEDGTFCVDGLALGAELDVTETAAPPGYVAADPATQAVTVSVAGDCDERGDAAVDATFVNLVVGGVAPGEEIAAPTPQPGEGTLGGTPAPGMGALPDTAAGMLNGVPAWLMSLVMLGSLGGLFYLRLTRDPHRRR